jgi:hypothetical protein
MNDGEVNSMEKLFIQAQNEANNESELRQNTQLLSASGNVTPQDIDNGPSRSLK